MFTLADGAVVVSDPGNARFLRLNADGRVAGPWQPIAGGVREATLTNLAVAWDARAVDARGRLYYEAQVIDVFGVDGRIAERISLAPHRRLLALTDAFIYLVYRDADDLEYVERVPRRR